MVASHLHCTCACFCKIVVEPKVNELCLCVSLIYKCVNVDIHVGLWGTECVWAVDELTINYLPNTLMTMSSFWTPTMGEVASSGAVCRKFKEAEIQPMPERQETPLTTRYG